MPKRVLLLYGSDMTHNGQILKSVLEGAGMGGFTITDPIFLAKELAQIVKAGSAKGKGFDPVKAAKDHLYDRVSGADWVLVLCSDGLGGIFDTTSTIEVKIGLIKYNVYGEVMSRCMSNSSTRQKFFAIHFEGDVPNTTPVPDPVHHEDLRVFTFTAEPSSSKRRDDLVLPGVAMTNTLIDAILYGKKSGPS